MMNVNLLPWRQALQCKKIFYFKMRLLVVMVIVTFVLCLWHACLWHKISALRKLVVQLKQQVLLLEETNKNHGRARHDKEMLQKSLNYVAKIRAWQGFVPDVLARLQQMVQANTHLTQLIIGKNEIKISGQTESMYGITQLAYSFVGTVYCVFPVIQKINKQGDNYVFTVTCAR